MGDLTSESRRAGSLYYGRLFLLSWLLLAFTLSTAALAQTTDADERVYVYVGDYNYPPYEFLDQEGRPSVPLPMRPASSCAFISAHGRMF